MSVTLDRLAELPVTELKGVGPERAKALADAFEIETVLDLVTHYPRRHLDLTKMKTIREVQPDDQVWVFGRIVSTNVVRGTRKGEAPARGPSPTARAT